MKFIIIFKSLDDLSLKLTIPKPNVSEDEPPLEGGIFL